MKLRYPTRARSDLAEIHNYIPQDNSHAARRVVQIVRKAAGAFPQNPLVGKMVRIAGTREIAVGRVPFLLAYFVNAKEMQFLLVTHTANMWPENL